MTVDVERLLKRASDAENTRQRWISCWDELARYFAPRKRVLAKASAGDAGDEHIFDSTPAHALELLASSLGGLLTNPALPWFDLRTVGPGEDGREQGRGRGEVRDVMLSVFSNADSGFQCASHEFYLDVALLGTGVLYVEEDPGDCELLRFVSVPLGQVAVSCDVYGRVRGIWRTYVMTSGECWRAWGEACPDELKRRVREDGKLDEDVEILHAVFPREDLDPLRPAHAGKDLPIASVYVAKADKHVLEESGYHEMPYMVARWSRAAGETYGRGPGLTALSDVRVLNAMARTALMAAEKMVDPPLMVPDDGFLGPVRSGPGGLSYYRAGSSDRVEALPVHADLGAAEEMMRQRRECVRRIFLNDQLLPGEAPNMSATEALIRQNEKMRLLGPVLGRMQAEFLVPLISRVYGIMARAGAFERVRGFEEAESVQVEYVSPIARAQKQFVVQGMAQTMEYLAPFIGEGDPFRIMDNFDTDKLTRRAAEVFGVPSDDMRPEDAVRKRREQASKAAQAEEQAQGVERAAGVAKDLGQARMDEGTALGGLERMLGGGGQGVER